VCGSEVAQVLADRLLDRCIDALVRPRRDDCTLAVQPGIDTAVPGNKKPYMADAM